MSYLLTTFGKYLASRDTSPPTSTTTYSSYNNNNTEVIIPQALPSHKQLPPNAKLLPLIHTHNGQPCQISIENQRKLQQWEMTLHETEEKENKQFNELDQQLRHERDKLTKVQYDYQNYLRNNDPNKNHYLIEQIENKYALQQADLDKKQHMCEDAVVSLLNQTPIPDMIKTTLHGEKPKYNARLIRQATTDPLFQTQWLPQLDQQYKNDLTHIENQLKSLQNNKPDPNIKLQAQKRLEIERNKLNQNLNNEKIKFDTNVEQLKRDINQRKSNSSNEWNTLNNKIRMNEELIKNTTNDLTTTRNKLKQPQITDNNNIWVKRAEEAKVELTNATNKLKAFETVAQNELNALQTHNQQAVRNYKEQINVECSNLDKICHERINEIKHNQKHTTIELSHGLNVQMPILTQQNVQLPMIKPVMVQTTVPYNLPQVVHIPVTTDFYNKDGELGDRYKPNELNLKPLPQGDTIITHSTTVPQIKAKSVEKVVYKNEIIEKPVVHTQMKTIQEKIETPTMIVHTPIGTTTETTTMKTTTNTSTRTNNNNGKTTNTTTISSSSR